MTVFTSKALAIPPSRLQEQPAPWKDRRLVGCLLSVLAWGLLAHGYGFLHSNFSHDELNAFYATTAENRWKLESGRFFVPVFRELVRGNFALPWVVGLLALLFIGLSLFLIVRILDLRQPLLLVLAAGILTTNLTVTAQSATYIHELDCNCFALLLSVCAVYLWYCFRGWLPGLGSILLVFLSIGIYQSFFAVAVTLMMLLSFVDLYRGAEVRTVFLRGLWGIAILVLGAVVYSLFGAVLYRITGLSRFYQLTSKHPSITYYCRLVVNAYRDFFHALHNDAYRSRFQPVLYLTDLLLVLGLVRCLVKCRKEPARLALMAALLFLLPLGMNVTYLLAKGDGIHDLTYYAVWFVWLLYPFTAFCTAPTQGNRLRKVLCVALLGTILWQNVLIANTAYMKKEVAEKGTYSAMTRVLDRLEQQEGYIPGETNVAFVGIGSGMGKLAEYGSVSNLIGMEFNSSIAKDTSLPAYNCYRAYFQYVLNYPINLCDDGIREELGDSEEVAQMPTFPDPGCIRKINNVFVVKMGEERSK